MRSVTKARVVSDADSVQQESPDGDEAKGGAVRSGATDFPDCTRDECVGTLKEQVIVLERELSRATASPCLMPRLTSPETSSAEELEASLAKAKGVVEQVCSRLLEGMESAGQDDHASGGSDQDTDSLGGRISAGAPKRRLDNTPADLSSRDKIALGLERLSGK